MAVFDNLNYSYSAGVAPSVVQYYHRSFLPNVKPEMVHNRDAQRQVLPLHNGKTVTFRRMTALPAITTPLVEGVTPEGQAMVETAFTAMVKPYGGHIEVTDELNFYLLNDKHQQAVTLLSDQASLSLDTISRNALNAGLNVQYAGSNTSRGTITAADKLTYQDIKKAVRTLRRANAKPFADGFFHGITHTDVYFDLTSDDMWIDVAKYQDKGRVDKYELGTIYKVKMFESTNAMVFNAQTEIVKGIASIAASANFDAEKREMAYNVAIDNDTARALTGLMVNVQYTANSTKYTTPMCIESVDVVAKKIKFRWVPGADVTSKWTTANTLSIVPYGGGASGAPVYSTLVYAQDSYGSVELGGDGRNVEIIINAPGSSGAADPLKQRGTIAWKVKGFCTVILQDDFIVRIESGASA
jgi:N4-gp56 family major capsid protein